MARCTKIIKPNTDEAKYVINVKQIAKARRVPPPLLQRWASTAVVAHGVILLSQLCPWAPRDLSFMSSRHQAKRLQPHLAPLPASGVVPRA